MVGGEDLVKKVQAGEIDFDVALATPEVMGMVGRLGKILGPRGLMPNPKAGTVTFDIASAIQDVQGGRVEFRNDRTGIIHTAIGKASFDDDKLRDNFAALDGCDRSSQAVRCQRHLCEDRDYRGDHGARHTGRPGAGSTNSTVS